MIFESQRNGRIYIESRGTVPLDRRIERGDVVVRLQEIEEMDYMPTAIFLSVRRFKEFMDTVDPAVFDMTPNRIGLVAMLWNNEPYVDPDIPDDMVCAVCGPFCISEHDFIKKYTKPEDEATCKVVYNMDNEVTL